MTIQEQFNVFFNTYNGKQVEAEDSTNLYQCFDLAFKWIDQLQVPREAIRHLRAYEIWSLPNDLTRQWFTLIPNTPTGVPQVGDIVIFNTVVGVSGHVCIANGTGDINSFKSFDQNWNGHRFSTTETHNYDGVSGWLRYKAPPVIDWQAKYNALKSATTDFVNKVNSL